MTDPQVPIDRIDEHDRPAGDRDAAAGRPAGDEMEPEYPPGRLGRRHDGAPSRISAGPLPKRASPGRTRRC